MAAKKLIENEHVVVTCDNEARLVTVVRTETAVTAEEAVRMLSEVTVVIQRLPRTQLMHLMDLRRAPGRNDPEFERVIRPYLGATLHGFARVAVLVRTAVGKLQTRRIGRAGGIDAEVFLTEQAAMAYLRTGRRVGD